MSVVKRNLQEPVAVPASPPEPPPPEPPPPREPLWWEKRVGERLTLQLVNAVRYYVINPANQIALVPGVNEPVPWPFVQGQLVGVEREHAGDPLLLVKTEGLDEAFMGVAGETIVGVHPVDVAFVTFGQERRIQT